MHRGWNIMIGMLVIVLTLATTWLLDGHRGVKSPQAIKAAAVATTYEAAPNVTFTDLRGKPVKLHNYRGKIVLLNFWATWCAPCIAEFPQFIKLAQAMPEDVMILAVSIDEDKTNIETFMKRYVPDYATTKNLKLLWDHDKSISQDLFQTVRVPETIIITPNMMMARKVAGLSIEWDSDETKKYLAGLTAD